MNASRTYRIVLRKEPDDIYTAIVPALPGSVTWGETVEHTLEMAIRDILKFYRKRENQYRMIMKRWSILCN